MNIKETLSTYNLILTSATRYTFGMIMYSIAQAIPVWFLWNNTLPKLIQNISEITWQQSFLLILLFKIFTRAWIYESISDSLLYQQQLLINLNNIFYNYFMALKIKVIPESVDDKENLNNSNKTIDKE